MPEVRPARWRNIVIFAVVTLVAGNYFGFNYDMADGLGGLLFILSPTLAALGLRLFGGDGWGDAGFRPHFKGHLGCYAVALFLFPAITLLVLGVGVAAGMVSFSPGAGAAIGGAMVMALASVPLFALLEEIGWRGYLDPRLAALGVRGLKRHGIVGLIWGLWHGGYMLSHPEAYGHLPFPVMLALTLAAIIAMAVIYGVLRAATQSLWPAVLAHSVGNLVAWPLIDPEIVRVLQTQVFAARPDGLIFLGLVALSAYILYRRSIPA